MRRAFEVGVTIALASAVLFPVTKSPGWDSFPISSYPMFSRGDLGTSVSVSHVVLVTSAGERRPAPPALVGTPEPMVAKALVETAIARGDTAGLCARVAARAKAEGETAARVEVATSVFDTKAYFSSDAVVAREARSPSNRSVHASCAIP